MLNLTKRFSDQVQFGFSRLKPATRYRLDEAMLGYIPRVLYGQSPFSRSLDGANDEESENWNRQIFHPTRAGMMTND